MPLKASWLYAFIVLSCIALLGYAVYVENVDGLLPCALCMTQRFFFATTGAFALIALLHRPAGRGKIVYSLLMTLSAGLGAAVAGRQLWLQSLPEDQVPACGPSLEYMLDTLPLSEAFKTLMMGDGNCAEVVWTFMGLSMPGWSLVWFAIFIVAALISSRAP